MAGNKKGKRERERPGRNNNLLSFIKYNFFIFPKNKKRF